MLWAAMVIVLFLHLKDLRLLHLILLILSMSIPLIVLVDRRVPFDGHGFVLWRSSMLTSLSAKNKLGLLDSRINQPITDSPYYPYWERCNNMVKAWITNFVSLDITISVMCFRTAKEVWADINERFGQSNLSKYLQIQGEISGIVQGSSNIATYFTKLRSFWDELNSSYVGPICSCGSLPKFTEDQQPFQFLNGLNDSYSTINSAIMIMSPLPPISKAYSLLQQIKVRGKLHQLLQASPRILLLSLYLQPLTLQIELLHKR